MRILRLETEPFHELPYAIGSGVRAAQTRVPFQTAIVDALPANLTAIIATADLQGVFEAGKSVAMQLADEIAALQNARRLPKREQTAILLAGDLHASADEADVSEVWCALGERCRWVAGVAGNHDRFAQDASGTGWPMGMGDSRLALLHDTTVNRDGLQVAGSGGIVGDHGGYGVRMEADFAAALARLADSRPDLLILHDGPNVSGTDLPGWPALRRVLEVAPPTLVIRGHDHWPTPLATLANGTQVLNVEGRVVILRRP